MGGKPGGPQVAFADLEGQGDKGDAQPLKLATPMLLISKAVLQVELCPTGPAPDIILESLHMMVSAGESVTERKDRKGVFGCLHIVLRDCAQNEEECRSIIFDHEEDDAAETDEHAEAMSTRNKIRKAIAFSFEDTKVWCLPKIPQDTAPDTYTDAPEAYVDKIHEIRTSLATQLSEPKLLNGQQLTGRIIARLLPELAEEMRSNKPALNPPSLIERVAESEARDASAKLLDNFKQDLRAIDAKLPMPPDNLEQELEVCCSRVTTGFIDGSASFGVCKAFPLIKKDLEKEVETMRKSLEVRNQELLDENTEEVLKEKKARIDELLEAIALPLASRQLENSMKALKDEMLGSALDASLSNFPEPLRERVRRGLADHISLRAEERRRINVIENSRRRSRNISFGSLAMLALAALLAIAAGDAEACEGSLTSTSVDAISWNQILRCWHRPEFRTALEDQKARKEEEEARLAAEEKRLREKREEEQRFEELQQAEFRKKMGVATGLSAVVAAAMKYVLRAMT